MSLEKKNYLKSGSPWIEGEWTQIRGRIQKR